MTSPYLPRRKVAPDLRPTAKVAQVELARRLTHAIWHMPTKNEPFAPAGATAPMAATTAP